MRNNWGERLVELLRDYKCPETAKKHGVSLTLGGGRTFGDTHVATQPPDSPIRSSEQLRSVRETFICTVMSATTQEVLRSTDIGG